MCPRGVRARKGMVRGVSVRRGKPRRRVNARDRRRDQRKRLHGELGDGSNVVVKKGKLKSHSGLWNLRKTVYRLRSK